MIDGVSITPSSVWDRGNGLETRPGIEPSERGNAIPDLPALAGTPCTLGLGGVQLNISEIIPP
jgi:hypothetical protein